jgi:hypothetical protein
MENFKTYGQFIVEAYSDEERKKLADKGFALSDGSFPIKDLKDLKNAIQAYGRAKDQARAAKFIVKRAKALGAEDLIPDTEDFQKSLGEGVKGYDVGPKLDDFDGMDFYNAQYEISDDKDYHDAADEDGWKSIFKIAKKYKSKLKKHGIKSDKDLENFAKWLSSGDHMKSESIVTEAKVKVTKKDIKDIEDSGNIDIAYKKAMALLKSLSESLITEAFKFSEKEVKDIAELIAKAIAKVDNKQTAVHDMEFDKGRGAGFEISMGGDRHEGGSYTVRPNGDVVNSAIGNSFPNAIYAKIGDKDINKVMKNIQKFESTVYTQVPAKTIALTEGTDIGSWNQGGLKANKNVLITQFVGPKDIEDFGLGRKCIQINVGMDYVSLNPADIVELKEVLKKFKK